MVTDFCAFMTETKPPGIRTMIEFGFRAVNQSRRIAISSLPSVSVKPDYANDGFVAAIWGSWKKKKAADSCRQSVTQPPQNRGDGAPPSIFRADVSDCFECDSHYL